MTLTSKPPTNFIDVEATPNVTSGAATLKVGPARIWCDSSGSLRFVRDNLEPASDNDGIIIGVQT